MNGSLLSWRGKPKINEIRRWQQAKQQHLVVCRLYSSGNDVTRDFPKSQSQSLFSKAASKPTWWRATISKKLGIASMAQRHFSSLFPLGEPIVRNSSSAPCSIGPSFQLACVGGSACKPRAPHNLHGSPQHNGLLCLAPKIIAEANLRELNGCPS